jgi:hypothetical protein
MLLRRGNRRSRALAFVAIGALLGVKVLRRHGKHLVALNADAVNNALGTQRRRGVRVVGCWRGLVLFRHGPILTQASLPASVAPVRQAREHTRNDIADAQRTLQSLGSGKIGRRRGARIDDENRYRPRQIAERLARQGNFQFRSINDDHHRQDAAHQRLAYVVGGFHAQRIDACLPQLGSDRRPQCPIARDHENDRHLVAKDTSYLEGLGCVTRGASGASRNQRQPKVRSFASTNFVRIR